MDRKDPKECTAMAGEMLAWLDEKTWTDEDKVAVAAGCLPVLLVRISKDKETFYRVRVFFFDLMKNGSEMVWKAQRGS